MKRYLTKYALTYGIKEVKAEPLDEYWKVKGDYNLFTENECFATIEEAVANAEQRRAKKIRSLEKQIERLKALKFDGNDIDSNKY